MKGVDVTTEPMTRTAMAENPTVTRMFALECPTAVIDKSMVEPGTSGEWLTPFPSYLIDHPDGLILFDTGLDTDAAGDPASVYGDSAASSQITYTAEQRLDRQLAELGWEVGDVGHVVLSHLHFDHTGGMKLFPHARFYAGEGEFAYARNPDAHTCGLYRLHELDAVRDFDWVEVSEQGLDMFGDGSVVLLFLPGHSPGSLALQVRLPSRTMILSGDVAHARYGYDTATPFLYDSDSVQAVESLKELKRLAERDDTELWIGHDPDDWEKYGAGQYK